MLITHDREKLINAIIYFSQNTRFCGKTKLFKLLYFMDFEHFKQTGRSITGMAYYAWKMGPVPVSLHEEIESPKSDMAEALDMHMEPYKNYKRLSITPKKDIDLDNFTKREIKIMRDIAGQFEKSKAEDMVEATHLENRPWHCIWHNSGKQQLIPYDLAIRNQEKELVRSVAKTHEEVVEALR